VALPFLIRAVGAHFAPGSPVTSHLGDLLFIWGNRFALDGERLREAGLRARVLITTSERAWSYSWQGGWLPRQVFDPSAYLPGRQPLVVLLEGRFPTAEPPSHGTGSREATIAAEGALLLIGCSEMFKNDYLYAPGFHHDQFLLNAVAQMAYGQELTALQNRRPIQRGFSFLDPPIKAFLRLIVVWTGPFAFLLYGLGRFWRDRRLSRRP